MATIDINKLIQESMSATLGEEAPTTVVEEGATETPNTDENTTNILESMKEVVATESERSFMASKDAKKAAIAANPGKEKRDASKNLMADIKAKSAQEKDVAALKRAAGEHGPKDEPGMLAKAGKNIGKAIDHVPGGGKTLAAGAAGLVGAGYMAKKFMKRKK